MTSPLFDPAIELAITVAKRGHKSKKNKIPAPTKLIPLFNFKTLPAKAREQVIEVLDEDEEFRERVAKKASEAEHGRFAYSYLARPDGWETYVNAVLEIEDEPIMPGRSDSKTLKKKKR